MVESKYGNRNVKLTLIPHKLRLIYEMYVECFQLLLTFKGFGGR
jgi:hypothetical protein